MITLIVARDSNSGIGLDGLLPWRIPSELKHFKETTLNHAVVFGRDTFESIPGKLNDRRVVVLSRDPNYEAPAGVEVYNSIEGALTALAATETSVFIAGGASVYRAALDADLIDRVLVTEISGAFKCDTFFHFDRARFPVVECISEGNGIDALTGTQHYYTIQVHSKV